FLMGVRTEKEEREKRALEGFVGAAASDTDHAAELRLFYVAATRGRQQIEVPPALFEKMAAVKARRAKKAMRKVSSVALTFQAHGIIKETTN
uniref:hypothetical protein n=1 Tax=uncultured Hyphomicrobium sp. TaxID=194373 RepID=UPI0025D2D1ED